MVALPIVFLIFISSNSPQVNFKDGTLPLVIQTSEEGIADAGKNSRGYHPKVNDLTTSNVHFPEEKPKVKAMEEKKIREKFMPDETENRGKTPVPLYSLVKNDCGEGYTLDENGVCQKSITVRNGKTFDSERRRKRNVPDYELMMEKNMNSFMKQLIIPKFGQKENKHFARNDFGKISNECNKLYPGLVSDGVGGCRKPV